MDITKIQPDEAFCWTRSFYIINTVYRSAKATVRGECKWIPCGEGGGSGRPPPPVFGSGTGLAVAQPANYWNSAEGVNVLALGGSTHVNAYKDSTVAAPSTWRSSGNLSLLSKSTSAEATGIAASSVAWDSKVHSESLDYDGMSDDEPFTVVAVTSISAEPAAVCVGNSNIAYTITTQPAGFEYMVSFTLTDTSTPGVKEVIATCGTSAATCTVTVIKLEIKNYTDITYDGLNSGLLTCRVLPEIIEPSSYAWSAKWSIPAYNDPQVAFENPSGESTIIQNAHWYSTTPSPGTGAAAFYKIYCMAKVNGISISNEIPAIFCVCVYQPGGACNPPSLGPLIIDCMPTNDYYIVTGIVEWNRTDAQITNRYLSTSQFYSKVQAHEQKHKDDYDNGFDGHVFMQQDEFAPMIIGLTNATIQGLDAMVRVKYEEYNTKEIAEMRSLVGVMEARAYAVQCLILYHHFMFTKVQQNINSAFCV